MTKFDAFISYKRDFKSLVEAFYKDLTKRHNLKLWLDDYELSSDSSDDDISKGKYLFINDVMAIIKC